MFILISYCRDNLKIFILTAEYKENDEIRITYSMYAALAYLLNNKLEEGWLMILEHAPQNEQLTLFPDYYIQQLMENQNVPIEMWNINKHRYRTNNAVKVGIRN